MDPFSITGTLIAIIQITSKIVTLCYDYRSSAKSASREIIQITEELNSLRDVVESLLRIVEKTAEGSSRLATFELLLRKGGVLEGCMEELERLRGKLEGAPDEVAWRRVKRRLEWPLKEGEMKRALEGLERLKGTMLLAVSADNATLSIGIKEDVGGIKEDVSDLTQMFQGHMINQEARNIRMWLAAPDPHPNHVANRKKRLPYTGNWLLTSKVYESWFYGSNSFLWLYGIREFLQAPRRFGIQILGVESLFSVIDEVAEHSRLQPTTAFAYFYFNFNDTGKQDVNTVTRSLSDQLASQHPSMPPSLLQLYRDHGNGTSFVEESTLVTTLRNLVLTFESVYLIFDALDESTECPKILELLHTIRDWNLDRLHVLATSRQLPDIEESLGGLCTGQICLHDSEANVDIIIYVEDALENDKALARWPSDIRQQIQKKLLKGEDGMFQWVVCQLEMLKKCMSVNSIRKAMSTLPKSLDDTYDRLLLNVDTEYQPEVMKVLQALTVTRSPLTLAMIVEILAVNLDDNPPRFEADSRLLDPRSILLMCSSLVTLYNPYKAMDSSVTYFFSDSGQDRGTLKLAHASVADYLNQPNPSRHSQFHFSRNKARQFMAQTCLTYLLNPVFAEGVNKKPLELRKRKEEYPFLQHCVDYWPQYLGGPTVKEQGDTASPLSPRTKEILQLFFATSKLPGGGNFASWVRMLIPSSPTTYVQNTAPLYYAASYGLLEVVQIILDSEEGVDINALGGRASSTALHVAVYRDHTDVVKLLLERGANPRTPNISNESPMYWARASGNKTIQKMLVEYGAKQSELWAAKEEGHADGFDESLHVAEGEVKALVESLHFRIER